MDKTRAMPILASAVMALSLAACQGMGGKESQQTSSAQPSAGQATSQTSRSTSAEQQAVAPDMVRDIQRTLGAKGYDAGAPDGIYGASTEQALRKFQRDQKLNATGQLDTHTLAALGLTGEAQAGQRAATGSRSYTPSTQRQGAMATQPSSRQTASAGASPDQVRRIQQNLADRGYDAGRVDGRWGPHTQQALRDFQRDQNLQASGRADPQTMAALGVESGSPSTQTGMTPEERRALPPSQPPERQVLPPEQQVLPPEQQALPPEQQVLPPAEPTR